VLVGSPVFHSALLPGNAPENESRIAVIWLLVRPLLTQHTLDLLYEGVKDIGMRNIHSDKRLKNLS